MQAVGADHQLESAFTLAFKPDPNTIWLFFQRDDSVAKEAFDLSLRSLKQQAGQLASLQRDIAPTSQFREYFRAEAGEGPAFVIHDAHFPNMITDASYLVE